MAINFPASPVDGQVHKVLHGYDHDLWQYASAVGAWIKRSLPQTVIFPSSTFTQTLWQSEAGGSFTGFNINMYGTTGKSSTLWMDPNNVLGEGEFSVGGSITGSSVRLGLLSSAGVSALRFTHNGTPYTVWHQGNMGYSRHIFYASQAASTSIATAGSSLGGIECQSQGSGVTAGAAYMCFHRPGNFAAYFGLDTDNEWKVGGWSLGANAYRVLHDGNTGSLVPFAPVMTPASGSITSTSCVGYYTRLGARTYQIWLDCTITNVGTGSGHVTITLPVTSTGAFLQTMNGREVTITGAQIHGLIFGGAASVLVIAYDNTAICATNARFVLSGTIAV